MKTGECPYFFPPTFFSALTAEMGWKMHAGGGLPCSSPMRRGFVTVG
jgi:hypothetical protein